MEIIFLQTSYRINSTLNEYYGNQENTGAALRAIVTEYADKLEEIDITKYKKGDFQKRILIDGKIKAKYVDYFGSRMAGRAFSVLMQELLLRTAREEK